MLRPSKRFITVVAVLGVVLGLVMFGLVFAVKDIRRIDAMGYSGALGSAVQLAIASEYIPSEKRPSQYYDFANPRPIGCQNNGEANWFAKADLNKCRFFFMAHQKIDLCGWYDYGTNCVSIVIPMEYFQNPEVAKRIFEAMKRPCAVFYDRNIAKKGTVVDTFRELSCERGKDYAKFDVYLFVIKETIDELMSRKAVRNKGSTSYVRKFHETPLQVYFYSNFWNTIKRVR